MKVWITRDALNFGRVKLVDGRVYSDGKAFIANPNPYGTYIKPGDWHETESAAKAAAEKKRLAKIASLKKQIAKLEAMKFEE